MLAVLKSLKIEFWEWILELMWWSGKMLVMGNFDIFYYSTEISRPC